MNPKPHPTGPKIDASLAKPRLVIFTRYPVAGMAKTRLIPALGAQGAADVHKCLTERSITTLRDNGCRVEVRFTGGQKDDFAQWLGDGLEFQEQVDGDLTDRLLDAMDPAPVIFFGSDTPDLNKGHVQSAIKALQESEVVIGPAVDGGYYLIGIAKSSAYLFEDMRWSTEHVLPDTLSRLEKQGIKPFMLEMLNDCDRPEDLANWPWLTP